MNTSGLLYADALTTGHPNDIGSEGYYATAPSLFHGAVSLWKSAVYGLQMEDYTLIDLGCGKGRVLLMASEYSFHAVVGVELNPKLAAIAQRNVTRWMRKRRACTTVNVIQGDVLDLPMPAGPLLLFIFNSFDREMVRRLLERAAQSSQRRATPIDLIYIHAEHDDLVRQTVGIECLANENISFSPEDAAADAFQVNVDQCCVYRLAGRLP